MLSTRRSLWVKLLALLLVCGLVMGCFAGCDEDADVDDDDDDERSSAEELREDLDRYEWNGLEFYLGDDMEELYDEAYGAAYTDEDDKISVMVYGGWTEDLFDEEIGSARELRNAYADMIAEAEDMEEVDKGKENGVYYVYADEDGTIGAVGFYYEDGYAWMVSVLFEDEGLKETAINYATLGQIDEVPEKDEETEETEGSDIEVPVEPEREQIVLSVWTSFMDQWESGWLENRLKAFEEAHPEYEITWELGICSEGEAGVMVRADPSAAADVYFFANDQMETLIQAGGLTKLGGSYQEQVLNDNSQTYIDTVTYTDGGIYGFPMTCNTWFMYYNKQTYTEEDIRSLDTMLEKGTVALQMGTGWYNHTFFTANGCTIFGENGNDADAGFQFGGQAGYDAALKMVQLASDSNFVDDANGYGMSGLIDGSVDAYFSGSWDYDALYYEMGDKLGCAPLPMVEIGGEQKQMKAFAGSKAIGVNPYSDNTRMACELAAFLASEESQLLRYQMLGITPAHKGLADHPEIIADDVAVAEMTVMNSCSIKQPVIWEMNAFWTPMGTFGGAVRIGDVDLDNYKDQVDLLVAALNSSDW